jgi:tetratricopeptide (TPR) repeat protein
VPRLGGDEVRWGLPEFRLASEETEDGLEWRQVTDNRWIIDQRFPLPAGDEIDLPVIGLAFSDDDAALESVRQYVAVPSLALDCGVTVFTERQQVAAALSGPLRIFSQTDEGGDGGIEALLSQLDVPGEGERESLRTAYHAVLRYDFDARHQIAQALNEATLRRQLALADAAIAREPNDPDGHATRAAILLDISRYEDAVESSDTAVNLGLDRADLHLVRGRALMSLGRDTEALSSFDRSLKLNPEVPETHFWRALALAGEAPDQEILAELEEALRLGFAHAPALSAFEDLLEGDAAVEFRRLLDRYRAPRKE